MARQNFELVIWIAALGILFFLHPEPNKLSVCFFRLAGLDECPGCGIGHSIHYALHLEIIKSLEAHRLGIPALLVIGHRIIQLFHKQNSSLYGRRSALTGSGR